MDCIKRLNIMLVDLPDVGGSVQSGTRACIIVQNDTGNFFAPTCIVIPFTSELKKIDQPTHVVIPKSKYNNLHKDSMLLFEQPITVGKKRVRQYIGSIESKYNNQINTALKISLGIQ